MVNHHSIGGKTVRNGRRPWEVMIIQNDIDKSKFKDPAACAAARAILRENANAKGVRVHIGRVFVEYEDHWERYQTPKSLRTEIIAYDRGGQFLPGLHRIPPLSPANIKRLELGKPSGKKPDNRKKKAKARRYNVFNVRPRGAVR